MSADVASCRPEASLNEAAHAMWARDCGVVPVVDVGERLVGVLTDRDVCMAAYLKGKPLRDLRVAESMTRNVVTCSPADSVEHVIRLMGDHQVRRIPVVDEGGRLAGIVSLNDLCRHLMEVTDERTRSRLTPVLMEAHASICEPRGAGSVPEIRPVPRAKRTARV